MSLVTKYIFTHPFFDIPRQERVKNGRKGARIAGYEPYSPEEDAYLIEHYQKIPFTHIAKTLGRSPKSISVRAKKLARDGLVIDDQRYKKSHYTPQEDAFIIACQDTMSFAQVGSVLGRSRDSVKVRAGKLGVSYVKIAETSPTYKLSNEDVELMRQLAESGMNYCEIARKFDVDSSHARKVCTFESRLYINKRDYLNYRIRQRDAIDRMD